MSAHQTEGHNSASNWWRSEQQGRVPHRSGEACESWGRWAEDVRLLAELGLAAYRLSVEWARLEPEPGQISQPALDHYRRQLEALRRCTTSPAPPGCRTSVAGRTRLWCRASPPARITWRVR